MSVPTKEQMGVACLLFIAFYSVVHLKNLWFKSIRNLSLVNITYFAWIKVSHSFSHYTYITKQSYTLHSATIAIMYPFVFTGDSFIFVIISIF